MSLVTKIIDITAGSLILVAEDDDEPTREQWKLALSHVSQAIDRQKRDMERVSALVISDGGSPNAVQRASMKDLLAGRPFRISVASETASVRVVVGIMSWFNRDMSIVGPRQIEPWFAHARVAPTEYETVWRHMWALQQRVGGLRTAAKIDFFLNELLAKQTQPSPPKLG